METMTKKRTNMKPIYDEFNDLVAKMHERELTPGETLSLIGKVNTIQTNMKSGNVVTTPEEFSEFIKTAIAVRNMLTDKSRVPITKIVGTDKLVASTNEAEKLRSANSENNAPIYYFLHNDDMHFAKVMPALPWAVIDDVLSEINGTKKGTFGYDSKHSENANPDAGIKYFEISQKELKEVVGSFDASDVNVMKNLIRVGMILSNQYIFVDLGDGKGYHIDTVVKPPKKFNFKPRH